MSTAVPARPGEAEQLLGLLSSVQAERQSERPAEERGPASAPAPEGRAEAKHLPSLDGLRAISIMLVLLGHLSGTQGFGRVDLGVGDYAHLGVVVFFIISGFLITRLLLNEQERKGRVSLTSFYLRRAIRLFPALYLFVGCVWVLSRLGWVEVPGRQLWYAATYTVNYLPDRAWPIGHLWSLSVEEQFYLVWPLAFILAGRRGTVWVAVAGMAMGPVARLAARFLLAGTPYRELEMFPMEADSIATGCLLACLQARLEGLGWYRRLFRPAWSLGLLAMVAVLNRYLGYTVVSVFGRTLLHLGLAVLIHRSVFHKDDRWGRVLNWGPLAWVGVLSYSLYLWQQLFLNRTSTAWANAFPQNLVLAVAVAVASYGLVEKPLLRWRSRLRR
ncbi:MAG: acyltransferase [Bryobacterales bacterium]|nr:acyltransferase [Bryobacterales bacterium]